jgi:subfamily B ATP-binding cassette protein MsbA
MSDSTSAALWRVTRKFLAHGRNYVGLIALTLLVVLIFSGARAVQGWLIKPVVDELSKGAGKFDGFLQAGDFREAADELAVMEQKHQHGEMSESEAGRVRAQLARIAERARARPELAAIAARFAAASESLDPERMAPLREAVAAIPRDSVEGKALSDAVKNLESMPLLFLRDIAILAVVLSIVMFIFGVGREYFTNYLNKRVTADIRNELVEHLTYLPLRQHHDRKAGDLISRVTNDIAATEQAANFFYDDALVHPIMTVYAVGLIFYANWVLAAAAMVLLPLYVLPLLKIGRMMRKARKQSLESMGDMTQAMVQTLGGIKVVKAFNMEKAQVDEFKGHNEMFLKKWLKALKRKAVGENLSQLFLGLSVALMLVGGGFMLAQRMMTPGDLTIFALGVAMINTSVRELTKSYGRLVESSAACDRIFEVLEIPRESAHETGEELDGVVGGVEFRKVSFAYNSEPVLRDIELAIAPGEVVALVGRSGAGKTTLCDLICRYYDPTGGEILVGGKDLRRLKRPSLLRHVAVVAQDTFLFNASIGDNIRYSRPDADAKAVEAAARAANIHDFIQTLPNAYDTVVGDRGAKLSGGQRQRVAIARAVLKDPDILILDEATSALDTESEKAVQDALAALIRGGRKRITLVIAHRLSTVRDADRIVVLDAGAIVESGKHEELLSKDGVYASLYKTQFAS